VRRVETRASYLGPTRGRGTKVESEEQAGIGGGRGAWELQAASDLAEPEVPVEQDRGAVPGLGEEEGLVGTA
jgi:hypothetical protein